MRKVMQKEILEISDSLEAMRKFAEVYAKRTGTFFCIDPQVTVSVIRGLSKHKEQYGSPLCPCRLYDNKEKEVAYAYWNCPCVPMRERQECHCMLFLKQNNEFSGNIQEIAKEKLL